MFTRGYPARVYSVLQAHSPLKNFLSSVASWCSHHWHRSWSQYFTDSFLQHLHKTV